MSRQTKDKYEPTDKQRPESKTRKNSTRSDPDHIDEKGDTGSGQEEKQGGNFIQTNPQHRDGVEKREDATEQRRKRETVGANRQKSIQEPDNTERSMGGRQERREVLGEEGGK